MLTKPQVVFIHGGDSFDNQTDFYNFLRQIPLDPYEPERQRWRDWLKVSLIATHEFFMPTMPNKLNADYLAWSIWWEKYLPVLRPGVILIGHSLGGSFLLRYLTENKLPINIAELHLVAPAIDEVDCPGLGNFSTDINHWPGFKATINAIHFWHASDDLVVPIHHSERLATKCPQANTHYFTDRGHFLQPEFPELLAEIKQA